MKNNHSFTRLTASFTAPLLVAGLMATAASLGAQTVGSARGGATKLLPAHPAPQPAETAPAENTMKCPQCRDFQVNIKEVSTKGSRPVVTTVLRHACPECETKIVWTGHGKAKTREVIHTCKHSADQHVDNCTKAGR